MGHKTVITVALCSLMLFTGHLQAAEIHVAVIGGEVAMVQALLSEDPDLVNAEDEEYGNTPLHYAAQKGFLELAELLLSRGADINARENIGRTPFFRANSAGHKDVADFLRKKGGIN